MPKAVYRSCCCDKHNCPRCDSHLGPLTPQSDTIRCTPLSVQMLLVPAANVLMYYALLQMVSFDNLEDQELEKRDVAEGRFPLHLLSV